MLVSSSRREDPCRSNNSICSASSSQFRATSSNALFMDRLLVCAARFLASAAFCRYSSDRDDIQGEHWKDASVPQITEPCDKCGVGQLVMTCRPAVVASPGPSCHATGRGDLDDPRLVSRNGRVE